MAVYTVTDFLKGDKVYHVTNQTQMMIVESINETLAEVSCKWRDKDFKEHIELFQPIELIKERDLPRRTMFITTLP